MHKMYWRNEHNVEKKQTNQTKHAILTLIKVHQVLLGLYRCNRNFELTMRVPQL